MWFLSLTAIAVIALALIVGFRKGAVRQIPSIIGFVMGAMSAHIFFEPVTRGLMDTFPYFLGRTETVYFYSTIGCGLVFVVVFLIFRLVTGFITLAFRHRESGVLDGIAGSAVSLIIYVTFLSLAFNWMVCFRPRSEAMQSMKAMDANIVEEVMMVAPLMIGSQTPEELRHLQQLEDASRIS